MSGRWSNTWLEVDLINLSKGAFIFTPGFPQPPAYFTACEDTWSFNQNTGLKKQEQLTNVSLQFVEVKNTLILTKHRPLVLYWRGMKSINWWLRYFRFSFYSLLHLNDIDYLIREVTITFFILGHLFSSPLLLPPFLSSAIHLFRELLHKCFSFPLRLNIQIDNGQAIHDNKSLTHNFCSHQWEKPNHSICSNCPEQPGLQ